MTLPIEAHNIEFVLYSLNQCDSIMIFSDPVTCTFPPSLSAFQLLPHIAQVSLLCRWKPHLLLHSLYLSTQSHNCFFSVMVSASRFP